MAAPRSRPDYVTAALQPRLLLALRNLESTPRVQRGKLSELVRDIRILSNALERDWFEFPEELRESIRLVFYELRDRRPSILDRLRRYYVLFRTRPDRAAMREYRDAVASFKDVLHDLLERENPAFQQRLDAAITSRRPASIPDPAPTNAREWSDWLQDL